MTFWKQMTLYNRFKLRHMGAAILDSSAAILAVSRDFEP